MSVASETAVVRVDVQQLRGIAVLAVILNHLDSRILPGGYLGVDMFFVVSGYVIVNSLLRQQNQVSTRVEFFRQFWIRRTFRLWPLLFATVIATSLVLVGLGLAYPGTLLTGLSSLVAASNFRLINGRLDYFALDIESDWFMHTWSLAAEEQIYLLLSFWAAFSLIGRQRSSIKFFAVGIGVMCAISLAFALSPTTSELIRFYSSHTRLYQVGFGALLAIGGTHRVVLRRKEIRMGITGVSCILCLAGIALLFATDVAAGRMSSLIVSFFTVLVIGLANSRVQTSGLVASKILTAIGDRSYSLYLVHWPVQLACHTFIENTLTRSLTSLVTTFAFGEIGFRVVEGRSRHRWRLLSPRRASLYSLIGLVVAVSAVSVILLTTSRGTATYLQDDNSRKCDDNDSDIWLVGDSHMDAIIPAVAEITDGNCRRFADYGPILSFADTSTSSAGQRTIAAIVGSGEPLISAIDGATSKPRAIVVVHFLTAFLSAPETAPASADFVVTEWRDTSGARMSRDAFAAKLGELLLKISNLMAAHGGVVIATSPPPDFDWLRTPIEDLSKCQRAFIIDSECATLRREASITRTAHERRHQEVNDLFLGLTRNSSNFVHLRLDAPFCDEVRCRNFLDGEPAFIDDDHISPAGRARVAPLLADAMQRALPRSLDRLACSPGTSVYSCRVRLTGGVSTGYLAVPDFIGPLSATSGSVVDQVSHTDEFGGLYCVRLLESGEVTFDGGSCGDKKP